jgi:hypothetical protein
MLSNDIIGWRQKVEKSQSSFSKAISVLLQFNKKCAFHDDSKPQKEFISISCTTRMGGKD